MKNIFASFLMAYIARGWMIESTTLQYGLYCLLAFAISWVFLDWCDDKAKEYKRRRKHR